MSDSFITQNIEAFELIVKRFEKTEKFFGKFAKWFLFCTFNKHKERVWSNLPFDISKSTLFFILIPLNIKLILTLNKIWKLSWFNTNIDINLFSRSFWMNNNQCLNIFYFQSINQFRLITVNISEQNMFINIRHFFHHSFQCFRSLIPRSPKQYKQWFIFTSFF